MGQRTQIALIIEDKEHAQRIIKVYHDQWGIGRRMYLYLLDLANRYYLNGTDYNEDRADKFTLADNNDLRELGTKKYSFKTRKEFAQTVKELLTPEGAYKHIFGKYDNNNGGLVVHIVLNKWSERDKNVFEYGFLLGYEDEYRTGGQRLGAPFSRWLSAEEFAKLDVNSRYTDEKFMQVFNGYADYFELKQIKAEEEIPTEVLDIAEINI